MKEKFLPIGSVVQLKEANKKIMITSYLVFGTGENSNPKIFDYGACHFPEGIIESDHTIAFNHDEIDKVYFVGCQDDDQKQLNTILVQTEAEVKRQFYDSVKESNTNE